MPDPHFELIAREMSDGEVVPFLGAGVNLCGRPPGFVWDDKQSGSLPDGSELAGFLARLGMYSSNVREVCCPHCNQTFESREKITDLVRMAQHVVLALGSIKLHTELRKLFLRQFTPTPVHDFLANLNPGLRKKKYLPEFQLVVTTNYDDLLEKAFENAGQPYDVVKYAARRREDDPDMARGKFWHRPWKGVDRPITGANKYLDIGAGGVPVILKIHGDVSRNEEGGDSFVIAEDDYIDYLKHSDLSKLLPAKLITKMRKSHFLFMGYGLRDWNLRVFLKRIWSDAPGSARSWAVQRNPDDFDKKYWARRNVDILDWDLAKYIGELTAAIDQLPSQG
jgi:hypothetical protein